MYKFSVSAAESSNAIRSPRFPVLESGNISFPKGRYTIECVRGHDECSYIIRHRIEGAPLILRLLEEKKAVYVCTVSSPKSSYRETYQSETEEQCICWNNDDFGEPPLLTPMIVSIIPEYEIRLNSEKDGVNRIWHDQLVTFKKGSRLALGKLIRFGASSILQLLILHPDKALGTGEFYVGAQTEGEFRFLVYLNSQLHSFLQKKDSVRSHIMTNIVTACFALLQRDFGSGEDGEELHPTLKILASYLKKKNICHWSEDEFRPEEAATKLYPHNIQERSEDR